MPNIHTLPASRKRKRAPTGLSIPLDSDDENDHDYAPDEEQRSKQGRRLDDATRKEGGNDEEVPLRQQGRPAANIINGVLSNPSSSRQTRRTSNRAVTRPVKLRRTTSTWRGIGGYRLGSASKSAEQNAPVDLTEEPSTGAQFGSSSASRSALAQASGAQTSTASTGGLSAAEIAEIRDARMRRLDALAPKTLRGKAPKKT